MGTMTIKEPTRVKSDDVIIQYLVDRSLNANVSNNWQSLPPMGEMPSMLKDQAI